MKVRILPSAYFKQTQGEKLYTKKQPMFLLVLLLVVSGLVLGGCSWGQSQADTASKNTSKDCEKFQCQREITAVSAITGEVLFQAEGKCSVENKGPLGFQAICKVGQQNGKGLFRKHYVTTSDNVTVVVTQLEPIEESEFRNKWNIKPSVPDLDLLTN